MKDRCETMERNTLFTALLPEIQRLICQQVWEPDLREDLVGETYCRFNELVDAYDPHRGIPLRSYLLCYLAYWIRYCARRQRRTHAREVVVADSWIENLIPSQGDVSDSWDDALMIDKTKEDLPRAMASLPLRYRQILVLRFYEGRPFEEIAVHLNVEIPTAYAMLNKALNNLRKRIAAEATFKNAQRRIAAGTAGAYLSQELRRL
jgi:RNA polymerase sigma factor (sigma-70 family)